MQPPLSLYSAQVSPGARLLGCHLWGKAKWDEDEQSWIAHVCKSDLRGVVGSPRGTLDRHIRELSRDGWVFNIVMHDRDTHIFFLGKYDGPAQQCDLTVAPLTPYYGEAH